MTGYKTKGRILIVEGEKDISLRLRTRLSNQKYCVSIAADGAKALYLFQKEKPDLVLLDIVLPTIDGYDVCKEIKNQSQTPIIILTALANTADRIAGLEIGADDYVIKPFNLKELETRISFILRDVQKSFSHSTSCVKPEQYQVGANVIHPSKIKVLKGKTETRLTEIEFKLLKLLIAKSGQKLSRLTLLNEIWGYSPTRSIDTRIVDVHISRLRSKIEDNPRKPSFIITIRGTGYMFQEDQYSKFNQTR